MYMYCVEFLFMHAKYTAGAFVPVLLQSSVPLMPCTVSEPVLSQGSVPLMMVSRRSLVVKFYSTTCIVVPVFMQELFH